MPFHAEGKRLRHRARAARNPMAMGARAGAGSILVSLTDVPPTC